MTTQTQDQTATNNANHDKEINFRKQEQALQVKYEALLQQERSEKLRLQQELDSRQAQNSDDDDDEPYVDKKKLKKELSNYGQQFQKQTQSEIQTAVQTALKEERKSNWLKAHPDFYDVLKHAETFATNDPDLAESILEMPEGFERQKLVYKNIKSMKLHEPAKKEASIQEKIDANRKSPFYQPSGTGTAGYSTQGDFSPAGQKSSYDKMQELKSRLRI